MIEKLSFQNPKSEHKPSINLDNHNCKGSKIFTCEILQYKDVKEFNIQEYNIWNDVSRLKANITFAQLLEITPMIKKVIKNYILMRYQRGHIA